MLIKDPVYSEILAAESIDASSPLVSAVERGEIEGVRLLLECKANPNQKDGHQSTPLIMTMCRRYNFEIIRLLLEKSADVTSENEDGETSLHELARRPQEKEAKFTNLLIDAKADVNKKDKSGRTPLCKRSMSEYP